MKNKDMDSEIKRANEELTGLLNNLIVSPVNSTIEEVVKDSVFSLETNIVNRIDKSQSSIKKLNGEIKTEFQDIKCFFSESLERYSISSLDKVVINLSEIINKNNKLNEENFKVLFLLSEKNNEEIKILIEKINFFQAESKHDIDCKIKLFSDVVASEFSKSTVKSNNIINEIKNLSIEQSKLKKGDLNIYLLVIVFLMLFLNLYLTLDFSF